MSPPWAPFVSQPAQGALALARRMLAHPATAWVFLGASLLVTAWAWHLSDRMVRLRLQERFELRTDEVSLAIRDRVASYEAVLRGGAGLFATDAEVTRQRWRDYVAALDLGTAFPGIQGMGYSRLIDPTSLAAHVQAVRNEGHPGYTVRPPGERQVYSSIIYLEPFDWRNQRAFGYDMFAEPVRRQAMEQARDSGRPAASGMVTLVQETDSEPQRGFLIYIPVYRPGMDTSSPAGRRAAIQGYVYAPFRMDDLMRGVLGKTVGWEPDLHFHVYDGETLDSSRRMYDSAEDPTTHADLVTGLQRQVQVELPGRHPWVVHYQAHRSFIDAGAAAQPLMIAIGGLLIDVLLFLGIADLSRQQKRSQHTERRLAAELERQRHTLLAGETRLSNALAGVGDGVWDWHVPSESVVFSDGWKAMLGHTAAEVGTGLDEWSQRVHPDDLARTMADVEDHLSGRTPCYRNEHRVRHRDGTWIWVLARGLAIERDATGRAVRVVGTHTDITGRKRLEEERAAFVTRLEDMVRERTGHLERANRDLAERDRDLRIFASVIEQSPLGVVLADASRVITYANGVAVRLLERGPLSGTDLVAGLQRDLAAQAHQALDGTGQWSCQTELDAGTPASRWLDLQIDPITGSDGHRIGFACLLRDLTQFKRLEIEHQRRMADLMQASKLAALGTLTAGIGHEIGNPANFISINAPLLQAYWQEVLPVLDRHAAEHPGFTVGRQPWPRIRALVPELYAGIESGVSRIRRLIGDLRQFAIPEAGDPRPVDANAMVNAALSLTRHAIDRATTRAEVSLQPGLPPVRGSFQRLEQVVVNLILNACQALPSADRGIAVRTRRDDAGRVLIEIADEGVGLDEADLPRLGEPFHTTRRERGGTGLGLSIVRRIVADHGGTIAFSSRRGHGTTVTIALPIDGQQAAPA